MEPIKLNIKLSREQEMIRRRTIEELCANSEVQRFLKQYHLSSIFVEKNTSYLERWLEARQRCNGCQGLSFCRQSLEGHVADLFIDDYNCLNVTNRPCRFQQKLDDQIDHQKQYRLSHLNEKDYLINFNSIDLKNEYKEYQTVYIQVINSLKEKKGIYLCGNPGVGKSYLMKCVANEYAKKGTNVSFVKVPQLISDLKSSFDEYDYQRELLNHLNYSDILILDDIGSESVSKWTRDTILFPVLDYRMEKGLKTYFTSNLPLKKLEEKYAFADHQKDDVAAIRITERIRTLSKEVKLSGNSRR